MGVCAFVPLLLVASQTCEVGPEGPQLWGYEVVAEFPHDPRAFTQGLQHDSVCNAQNSCSEVFWESTGQYGASSVRKTTVDTGVVQAKTPMSNNYFGEGLTRFGDKLYQITWLTNEGFIYSIPDLKQVGTFRTPLRDGWGITTVGKQMVLSDGSAQLTWVDQNFKTVKTVTVKDRTRSIGYLNELEYINGEIWANIWQTACIARICPDSGQVKGWVLMHGLQRNLADRGLSNHPMDVLNGIAYDSTRKRLFVTGKYWPRIFEIVPQPLDPSNAQYQQLVRTCYVKA
jgi:glutamine cyclotransferase